MTEPAERAPVVVAVDDTSGARAALHWAAAEAMIRKVALLPVHVPADADVIATLIELSSRAALLVLGTTGSGGNLASLLGSVSQRVAVHAHCPVAIIGEQFSASTGDREYGVVVGLSDTRAGLAALRFGFTEADRRGSRLTAVRAAAGPGGSNGEPDVAEQAALAAGRRRYPGTPVSVLVSADEPVRALAGAAQHADLLVLGAHHSDDRWSTRLGPVPQSLLHHTGCPIILIGSSETVLTPA